MYNLSQILYLFLLGNVTTKNALIEVYNDVNGRCISFILGHLPYPGMGPHEVVEKIQTGYRMPQPLHCSEEM